MLYRRITHITPTKAYLTLLLPEYWDEACWICPVEVAPALPFELAEEPVLLIAEQIIKISHNHPLICDDKLIRKRSSKKTY